jgi:hypothetical protein
MDPGGWSGQAPLNASTTAYAANLVAKASSGRLWAVKGYNSGPAQFLQLHDAAALPANGAVPVAIFIIPATANFEFDFGLYGRAFDNGITFCNSSTGPTKTIGAADCWIDARFS